MTIFELKQLENRVNEIDAELDITYDDNKIAQLEQELDQIIYLLEQSSKLRLIINNT